LRGFVHAVVREPRRVPVSRPSGSLPHENPVGATRGRTWMVRDTRPRTGLEADKVVDVQDGRSAAAIYSIAVGRRSATGSGAATLHGEHSLTGSRPC
jgi:hypothetical protein